MILAAALHDDKRAASTCCKSSPCTRAIPGIALWTLPDGRTVEQCPYTLVDALSFEMLRWHDRYRRGILPVSGGMLDQVAWYIAAMSKLDEVRP